MRARTWKWLAPAAAAAMLAVVFLWPSSNGSGKVYAMSDVPQLLRHARTLHIQGWGYDRTTAAPGKEPRKAPYEWWYDLENGRMRASQPNRPAVTGDDPPLLARTLDGQYMMDEMYTKHVGGGYTMGVKYERMTPFRARLEIHNSVQVFLVQLFGRADLHEGFQKVGQETIEGEAFDIWQGETDVMQGYALKIRSWLSPKTGDLGRVHVWIKMPGPQTDWIPAWGLERIERDAAVPAGLFSTEPPKGYTLHNTKENAPYAELPRLGGTIGRPDYALKLHMAFTLADGSVILGWDCTGEAIASPEGVYKDLTAGGELPELPLRITTVQPLPAKEDVQYAARHLAYTVKDGVYYEWSLHVPAGRVPPRSSFLMYNFTEKERGDGWSLTAGMDLEIASAADFDTWVRGAMAEFSDKGVAPAYVTYDFVRQLCQQIRQSTQRPAGSQPAS